MKEHPLSIQTRKSLTDPNFETKPGYCYRLFRENRQSVYGHQFDKYDDDSDRPTAKKAEENWRESPYVVTKAQGYAIGDVYFYGDHGPDGHVGTRIPGNLIADNSITHHGRIQGGKGVRPLEELGEPTTVIRLPLYVPRRR